jgi:hypothetical protein
MMDCCNKRAWLQPRNVNLHVTRGCRGGRWSKSAAVRGTAAVAQTHAARQHVDPEPNVRGSLRTESRSGGKGFDDAHGGFGWHNPREAASGDPRGSRQGARRASIPNAFPVDAP